MAPALRHGDQVVVWLARRPRPRAGAVVLVDLPGERGLGIKRLRRVEPSGQLWLQGDNPAGSTDSRQFGAVPATALRGRVLLRLWPRPGRVSRRGAPNGPSAV
jgi:nickel-type superoxide dismutase maturation protease